MLEVQYFQLKTALAPSRAAAHGDIPVTVDEIAGLLFCTTRNVKILLNKMVASGWIAWTPGKGRGNRSTIRFLTPADELLVQAAKDCVEQGNLKGAMGLFQQSGVDPASVDRFMAWLSDYFGYKEQDAVHRCSDTLRLPMMAPLITLDPADSFYARDLHFVKQIFETLIRFNPAARSFEPHLAHSWETDASGKLWTFYLRKGIAFHHGREMTSSDVAFSILRLKERGPDSTNGWLASSVRAVRPLDKLTVLVELETPNFMFPHYASSSPMSIVPEDVYGSRDDVDRYPVGTGPFMMTRNDQGSIVLEAYTEYFKERPHLDRIEMLHIPQNLTDNCTADLHFHIGKTHHLELPVPSHWNMLRRVTLGASLLTFNVRKPGPQRDRRLRKAIHLVLDRQRMIEDLHMDGAIPAANFMPPDSPIPVSNETDLDLALELVRQSDYRGETIRLLTMVGHREMSEWIRDRCQTIGVKTEIIDIPNLEGARKECIAQGDCAVGGVVGDDDIDRSLLEMYKMGNLVIRCYASDELVRAFDDRIDELARMPDAAVRSALIRRMERLLTEDHHVLFLAHIVQKTFYSPDVKGVSLNTLGWFDFKEIWFKPQACLDA